MSSFSILGGNSKCFYAYRDGLLKGSLPEDVSRTWEYLPILENYDLEYGKIYCQGKNLYDVCPERLKKEWNEAAQKIAAFLRSFRVAKINLNLEDLCEHEAIPEKVIEEYLRIQLKITDHVFDTYSKPENYDLLFSLWKMVAEIQKRSLNISSFGLSSHLIDVLARERYKKIVQGSRYVKYDIFGSRTGRLKTKIGSFPVLSFDKLLRSCLLPKNDMFVEFDFTAFEPSVALLLSGREFPEKDLHIWHQSILGTETREKTKQEVMHWLYGGVSEGNSVLEKEYNTELLRKLYYDGERRRIKTIFGREIEDVDAFHALSYLVQSTAADIVSEQAIKLNKTLKDKKSYLSFLMHDAVILDVKEEEIKNLSLWAERLRTSRLGRFNIKIRLYKKNYGQCDKEVYLS